jgi:hypothetical protein
MKPTKAKKKNLPKLRLADLLKRRKMTLKQLLDEFGITTYAALTIRCERMGVQAPSQEEFDVVAGTVVSSPTEGVVVLEAPPVIEDCSGKEIVDEDLLLVSQDAIGDSDDVVAEFDRGWYEKQPQVDLPVQKKRRKKDKDTQTDE